jgi:hypothetical protein
VKGKLAPRYVGPYRICQRISKLAYKVEFSEELTGVHLVFHMSQPRKCLVWVSKPIRGNNKAFN